MRRVAITGLGVVSALGIGVEAFWEGLTAGRSGIRRITLFDPSALTDRKSTRLNSSHIQKSRMPSSA